MILHGEMAMAFGVLDVSTSTYAYIPSFGVVVTYFNY
jgi:hypothetical protein